MSVICWTENYIEYKRILLILINFGCAMTDSLKSEKKGKIGQQMWHSIYKLQRHFRTGTLEGVKEAELKKPLIRILTSQHNIFVYILSRFYSLREVRRKKARHNTRARKVVFWKSIQTTCSYNPFPWKRNISNWKLRSNLKHIKKLI